MRCFPSRVVLFQRLLCFEMSVQTSGCTLSRKRVKSRDNDPLNGIIWFRGIFRGIVDPYVSEGFRGDGRLTSVSCPAVACFTPLLSLCLKAKRLAPQRFRFSAGLRGARGGGFRFRCFGVGFC